MTAEGWGCPLCGNEKVLLVVLPQPPSHGCPKNRGRGTEFVKKEGK